MIQKCLNKTQEVMIMTEHQFSQLLKGNQTRYDKPCNLLKDALGISLRTTTSYINEPSKMSVADLIIVIQELNLRDDDLLEYLKKR